MYTKLKINDDLKKYLATEDAICGGYHWTFIFDNGYGASIIKHRGSYGHEQDLFELAVIKLCEDGKTADLCYDTGITNNVLGFLTNEEVMKVLYRIKDLKKEEE